MHCREDERNKLRLLLSPCCPSFSDFHTSDLDDAHALAFKRYRKKLSEVLKPLGLASTLLSKGIISQGTYERICLEDQVTTTMQNKALLDAIEARLEVDHSDIWIIMAALEEEHLMLRILTDTSKSNHRKH